MTLTNDTNFQPIFPGPNSAEGVDFIETEEDAKAVEAATLKIQSTFRGKKFRSKLGADKKPAEKVGDSKECCKDKEKEKEEAKEKAKEKESGEQSSAKAAQELSAKVAEMQVNDKSATAEPASVSSSGEHPLPAKLE